MDCDLKSYPLLPSSVAGYCGGQALRRVTAGGAQGQQKSAILKLRFLCLLYRILQENLVVDIKGITQLLCNPFPNHPLTVLHCRDMALRDARLFRQLFLSNGLLCPRSTQSDTGDLVVLVFLKHFSLYL
jgi:hypothetical protein